MMAMLRIPVLLISAEGIVADRKIGATALIGTGGILKSDEATAKSKIMKFQIREDLLQDPPDLKFHDFGFGSCFVGFQNSPRPYRGRFPPPWDTSQTVTRIFPLRTNSPYDLPQRGDRYELYGIGLPPRRKRRGPD